MKTYAAYYALIALNSIEQDDNRLRVELNRPPRPSFLARARSLVSSVRPAPQPEPTTTPA